MTKYIQDYELQQNKAKALKFFKDANFSKEDLERVVAVMMVEGGVPLQDIEQMVKDWQLLLQIGEI